MTSRELVIPGDEWDTVRRRVVPFTSYAETREILGMVHLTVVAGDRRWEATDGYTVARLVGGATRAADVDLLIPAMLFRPARPRPSKVTVVATARTVAAVAPEWPHPRAAQVPEGDYADLDVIREGADRRLEVLRPASFRLRRPIPDLPNPPHHLCPLLIEHTHLWLRRDTGWDQLDADVDPATPMLFALSGRLVNRIVKAGSGASFQLLHPLYPLPFYGDDHLDGLLMPMRAAGISDWITDLDADELERGAA